MLVSQFGVAKMTFLTKAIPALAASLLLIAGGIHSASAQDEQFVTIGTAGQTGIYYVVGQSICKFVNQNQSQHGLRCTAPATGGSIANLNAIAAGDMNMGTVQSDWMYHAYRGTTKFAEQGPNDKLRTVFTAHPDVVTVVARSDSDIETLADLKGKRVNIGNPGSGSRASAEVLLAAVGIDQKDLALASELKSAEQSQALCDNKIQAMIFSAGHPVGNITEATVSCDVVFIQIAGPEIDRLVEQTPYYAPAVIPAGMYQGQDDTIQSFGPVATLATSTDTDEETVYQVVKAVFDNFGRFRELHPAFGHLEERAMISNGLTTPLHEGAVRYYKERGWM
jgi:TRAP transporter TAXI family solute receptor